MRFALAAPRQHRWRGNMRVVSTGHFGIQATEPALAATVSELTSVLPKLTFYRKGSLNQRSLATLDLQALLCGASLATQALYHSICLAYLREAAL